MGVTAAVYGVALLVDNAYPKWLGALAATGGVSAMIAGVVTAYNGFSRIAMAISMLGSSVLLVWIFTMG